MTRVILESKSGKQINILNGKDNNNNNDHNKLRLSRYYSTGNGIVMSKFKCIIRDHIQWSPFPVGAAETTTTTKQTMPTRSDISLLFVGYVTICVCVILNLVAQPGESQIMQQQQLLNNQTKTLLVVTEKPPNYIETGRQITGILDRFMSLGYDKRVRPNYGGPPVEVNVTMRILSISSVSEVMMDFTADFYFRQTWHDPRLSFKKLGDIQTLYVGAEVSKKIWLPDTFFGNEKLAYFHEATTPNVFLRIDHSGEVYRSIRLTVTSSCPMNLQYFPMDRQRCTIEAESYGYNVKDIIYRWARDTAVERDDQISLPQFDIVKTVQKYRLEELSSGTYSRLIAEIHFARRMGYYLIQIYIPSSLIVVISWVSFWLHRNASPARVQLGVTTVLTMTTLMSSTNAALPKISYVKSIDIFLGTCFIMVFAALLEYATVGYLGKRIAMRKAQLQHAHSQAQARLFAQLQAQGAQGDPMPPISASHTNHHHHQQQQQPPLGSPLGAAAGFVTGQTGQTNWMDELTAMAAAANAGETTDNVSPIQSHQFNPTSAANLLGRYNTNTHDVTQSNQVAASGGAATAAPQVPIRSHCSHLCHVHKRGVCNEAEEVEEEEGEGDRNLFTCNCNCRNNCGTHAQQDCGGGFRDHSELTGHKCRQGRPNNGSGRPLGGSCRCNHSNHHACSGNTRFNGSRTLPRNLTFAMEDIQDYGHSNQHRHNNHFDHLHNNHHHHHQQNHHKQHATSNNSSQPDKLQQAMLGMNVSPSTNRLLNDNHHHHHHHNHLGASMPPSYGGAASSKGASAAAAAAAATFINLHRKNKGLPPLASSNPTNFGQFSWMGQQHNSSLETIFGIRPSDIDKYSRVVFPVCFVCFQLMYWIVYLHISAFLESEQQQQPHT